MACTDAPIRETLLEMHKDEIKFDYDNDRVIWRKIFLAGILESCSSDHYWVIDGLDECPNAATLIGGMLAKLGKSTPLRVLVISREISELRKQFLTLDAHQFQSEKFSTTDTLRDIEALVKAKSSFLAAEDEHHRAALVDKILQKSKGSFLWTALVLNELSNAHSRDEINQVLEDIPRGMEQLYNRALECISQSARAIQPTKAILTWATTSVRPLILEELEVALKLDINSTFPRLGESIMALCGQLVTVDKFGKVQMIHETAREFLLNRDLQSEFAINHIQADTQVAKACLLYLTGEEMRPPRTGRRSRAVAQRSPFSAYACTAFSHHLVNTDPFSNDILSLVEKFLRSNVLSWIESVSQTGNLLPLIRAAKDLRIYHDSCAAVRSPLASSLQTIKGWATDLVRITAKFADALIVSPSAIYSLVLPFCPEESAAFKTVKPGRMLSVVGASNSQWDDRLACIDFSRGQATAVCHGDDFFAVGLSTGAVILYHSTTCQEFKTLGHGEAVKYIQFRNKSDFVVSCGLRTIRVWSIHNDQPVYCFQAPSRPIGLVFHGSSMIVACDKNYLASWNLDDGTKLCDRPWDDCTHRMNLQPLRVPSAISISMGHQMLAAAYTGRPILLWDLEEDAYYGSCGKKLSDGGTSTHAVTALVLNPNPSINMLAASYLDGELVLIDPLDDQVLASSRANCHTLASSPDGRFLAGGAGFGVIHIYEFDTLRQLYRVQSSNLLIKQLAFSKDGFHFLDIRASQCNVWEPAALVRDLVSDGSSESVSTSLSEAASTDSKVKITSMDVHQQDKFVFCGKNDGSVSLYDLRTGIHVRTLYFHKSLVRIVVFLPQRAIIMSIDASNRIFGWELTKAQEGLVTETLSFQSGLDCGSTVTQVLAGEGPGKFVLSTKDSDHLWNLGGRQEKSRAHSYAISRHWIQHPRSPSHMICLDGAAARVYDWDVWTEVLSVSVAPDVSGLHLRRVIPSTGGKSHLLLALSRTNGTHDYVFRILDASMPSIERKFGKQAIFETIEDSQYVKPTVPTTTEISDGSIASAPTEKTSDFGQRMAHIIGPSNNKLVFLDTTSWICSVDIDSLRHGPESYTRHFFVPYEWFGGKRDVIGAVVQLDVVLVRNDEVAIIRGGLEYAEEAWI